MFFCSTPPPQKNEIARETIVEKMCAKAVLLKLSHMAYWQLIFHCASDWQPDLSNSARVFASGGGCRYCDPPTLVF